MWSLHFLPRWFVICKEEKKDPDSFSWNEILLQNKPSFQSKYIILICALTLHQPWQHNWRERTPAERGTRRRRRCCSTRRWPWCRPRGAGSCWWRRWWWTWRGAWWWWAPPGPGRTCGPARRTSRTHRPSWRWGCRWWTRSSWAASWTACLLRGTSRSQWPSPHHTLDKIKRVKAAKNSCFFLWKF